MQVDDHRERPVALGKAQFPELQRVAAVGDDMVRCGIREVGQRGRLGVHFVSTS